MDLANFHNNYEITNECISPLRKLQKGLHCLHERKHNIKPKYQMNVYKKPKLTYNKMPHFPLKNAIEKYGWNNKKNITINFHVPFQYATTIETQMPSKLKYW